MKLALLQYMKGALLAILLISTPALAKRRDKKPKPAPAQTQTQPTTVPAPEPKQPKVKVYSFSGLDVEGKLKTPQLLYFLNRIKAEFDTSTLDKRSFIPELEASADDKAL